jgi:hypothetical protein
VNWENTASVHLCHPEAARTVYPYSSELIMLQHETDTYLLKNDEQTYLVRHDSEVYLEGHGTETCWIEKSFIFFWNVR